jgi:hypothetical protein
VTSANPVRGYIFVVVRRVADDVLTGIRSTYAAFVVRRIPGDEDVFKAAPRREARSSRSVCSEHE